MTTAFRLSDYVFEPTADDARDVEETYGGDIEAWHADNCPACVVCGKRGYAFLGDIKDSRGLSRDCYRQWRVYVCSTDELDYAAEHGGFA